MNCEPWNDLHTEECIKGIKTCDTLVPLKSTASLCSERNKQEVSKVAQEEQQELLDRFQEN